MHVRSRGHTCLMPRSRLPSGILFLFTVYLNDTSGSFLNSMVPKRFPCLNSVPWILRRHHSQKTRIKLWIERSRLFCYSVIKMHVLSASRESFIRLPRLTYVCQGFFSEILRNPYARSTSAFYFWEDPGVGQNWSCKSAILLSKITLYLLQPVTGRISWMDPSSSLPW